MRDDDFARWQRRDDGRHPIAGDRLAQGVVVLVGANEGRVEHEVFVLLIRSERGEHALPDAGLRPTGEALVGPLILAVPFSGRSPQCAPERSSHKPALTNKRLSLAFRPGPVFLPASKLALRAHWTSVSSYRLTMPRAPNQLMPNASIKPSVPRLTFDPCSSAGSGVTRISAGVSRSVRNTRRPLKFSGDCPKALSKCGLWSSCDTMDAIDEILLNVRQSPPQGPEERISRAC